MLQIATRYRLAADMLLQMYRLWNICDEMQPVRRVRVAISII
jgi:hypothetical protein